MATWPMISVRKYYDNTSIITIINSSVVKSLTSTI